MIINEKKYRKKKKNKCLTRKLHPLKIQHFNILWYNSGKHIWEEKGQILALLTMRKTSSHKDWMPLQWEILSQTGEEFCVQYLEVFFHRKFYWHVIFSWNITDVLEIDFKVVTISQELYPRTHVWGHKSSRLKLVLRDKVKAQCVLKRIFITIPPGSQISGNSCFHKLSETQNSYLRGK